MSEAKIAPIPDLGTRTDEITIFAGPCSVESAEQFEEVAECVAGLGLTWIRGGAFKPRTNRTRSRAWARRPSRSCAIPARSTA